MAIIEALKYRYNLGKRDNLNFFRDSSGNEIDLIYNISHNFLPIEIKSGQSITSGYFKGLKKFKKFFPDLPYGQLIIYAGDTSQNRTDVKIITVNRFSELLERIDQWYDKKTRTNRLAFRFGFFYRKNETSFGPKTQA